MYGIEWRVYQLWLVCSDDGYYPNMTFCGISCRGVMYPGDNFNPHFYAFIKTPDAILGWTLLISMRNLCHFLQRDYLCASICILRARMSQSFSSACRCDVYSLLSSNAMRIGYTLYSRQRSVLNVYRNGEQYNHVILLRTHVITNDFMTCKTQWPEMEDKQMNRHVCDKQVTP